jgi:hypothetical protein
MRASRIRLEPDSQLLLRREQVARLLEGVLDTVHNAHVMLLKN